MLSTSSAYATAYNTATSLKALPKVIVEWDHNRYASTVTASNAGQADVEPVNFPITSIIEANRPGKGLIKARVGEAYAVGSRYTTQYRTIGPNASYKYWTSATQSDANGVITGVNPSVVYGQGVSTNKIVVGVENSWATPTVYYVDITYDGTTWTNIANTTGIDAEGRIILYRQSNGSWGTAEADYPMNIMGVRFRVTNLNRGNAHLNLIGISARLQKDISADVISVDVEKSSESASLVFPLGEISSNTASVQLDNSTAKYDVDNTAGPYYGLLDQNAEVRIYLGTDVSQFGGGWEYIPQGVYYADGWNLDADGGTVTLASTDYSKFLQSEQMAPVLFQNRLAAQIVTQILTSVGFNKVSIPYAANDADTYIPYVWFTEETNVWEAIKSICDSTQSTAFFDEYGNFKFIPRGSRFANLTTPNQTLRARNDGSNLANIASVDQEYSVEANKVVINYKPYVANSRKVPVDRIVTTPVINFNLGGRQRERHYSEPIVRKIRGYDDIPIDSVLWKPEGTVTLRGTALRQPMTTTTSDVFIADAEAVHWPYSGFLNIEGEVMSYEGKEYRYFSGGVARYAIIHSAAEKRRIDDLESDLYSTASNSFTGRLANIKRGQMGTRAASHSLDLSGWQCYRKNSNQTVDATPVRQKQQGSEMVLWGYSGDNNETYTMSQRGLYKDKYRVYGTKVRFAATSYTQGTAGMYWCMQSDRKQAYYVELNLTSHAVETMKGTIKNVRVYKMHSAGNRTALPHGTKDAPGKDYNIVKDQWVSIDVTYDPGSEVHRIYIDGKLMHTFVDPAGTLPPGTWGPFVRGHTVAAFEYFYIHNSNVTPDIEQTSFMDKVNGSFVSGYADREVSKGKKTTNWYFDEFGPWVHEIREFDIKFDKFPALDSNVFLSNDWGCYLMGANSTPFSSQFWLANASRGNATINGEDPTTINGTEIKQALILYGQLILEEEVNSLTVKSDISNDELENAFVTQNDSAIRKRGVVELVFDSDWIQSEPQAKILGDFITAHWSEPVDNITVEGYFSPATQVGDLVAVDWPARHMYPSSHKYHVIGVKIGYQEGISTTLTLRRAR